VEVKKSQIPVEARSYTLRTKDDHWLGQIVLTSDGMFSGVTEYGNMSFAWRGFGDRDFREFILELGVDYFSSKMFIGASYAFGTSSKNTKACDRFTQHILPALKEALREEMGVIPAEGMAGGGVR
jgi:hypothetical protein